MKYLIDSYAWMEYLDGSPDGEIVRSILLQNDEIYTISLVIAEVISGVMRKNGDINATYEAISSNSNIICITPEIAREAGIFHADTRKKIKDFGLMEAIIYITGKRLNAKIVTGDQHFQSFKDVIFLSSH